ncbi:FHA domain-containing protein [Fervidobacterium sp. 2310opik-2]|uniref:FHA domain-containing protein n=1 Tax=Fervidobacterium sp. 2310opik-2 TaxID=1755815 RepID=UPI0013DF9B52|nr:FHA domain-containing protein [Fervidobacterium sp. 2310opik-2]KAF2961320.1 hypothetical protein AS161_01885 [Fervidobacterium sp. 2310opik-2]
MKMLRNYYFENLFDEEKSMEYEKSMELEIYYNKVLFMAKKIENDETVIGKSSTMGFVDIDISSIDSQKEFSRLILKILRENDKYYVTDISSNIVYLNKTRLEKNTKYEIDDGDILLGISPNNAFGIKVKRR